MDEQEAEPLLAQPLQAAARRGDRGVVAHVGKPHLRAHRHLGGAAEHASVDGGGERSADGWLRVVVSRGIDQPIARLETSQHQPALCVGVVTAGPQARADGVEAAAIAELVTEACNRGGGG